MLMVMEHHVHRLGLRCCTIRGDVPALKRMELVEAFNTDPDGPQVPAQITMFTLLCHS